jgi:hypothetical protein
VLVVPSSYVLHFRRASLGLTRPHAYNQPSECGWRGEAPKRDLISILRDLDRDPHFQRRLLGRHCNFGEVMHRNSISGIVSSVDSATSVNCRLEDANRV